MSSIFNYVANRAALAVGYGINAYDCSSPKVASAAIAAKAMRAQASYTAKTKIVSALPNREFMQLKKKDVAEALFSLNQSRAYTKVLVEEKFRFPDAELTAALGVHGKRLGHFNDQMGRLSEAQTVFRNDCLKLAGKAALVAAAAVFTVFVAKAAWNHFTAQPVKPVETTEESVSPVVEAETETASPSSEYSI